MNASNESHVIQQASAIPYRRQGDDVEFCLITTLKRKRWTFPKGIIDPGETYLETALKEADEEAGLHGIIVGEPIGEYEYEKWDSQLVVTVVIMEVTHSADTWDEASLRERRWVSYEQARELLSQPELINLLDTAWTEVGKLKH